MIIWHPWCCYNSETNTNPHHIDSKSACKLVWPGFVDLLTTEQFCSEIPLESFSRIFGSDAIETWFVRKESLSYRHIEETEFWKKRHIITFVSNTQVLFRNQWKDCLGPSQFEPRSRLNAALMDWDLLFWNHSKTHREQWAAFIFQIPRWVSEWGARLPWILLADSPQTLDTERSNTSRHFRVCQR